MKSPKYRATILHISGREKYELIKAVIARYNDAFEKHFYFEATALIESLISDRLESRLGELTNKPIKFNTIGGLTKLLSKIETDSILLQLMNDDISNWCHHRNHIIHEAAKIEINMKKDWDDFLKQAETTAQKGRLIFNSYNKQLNKLRKNTNK